MNKIIIGLFLIAYAQFVYGQLSNNFEFEDQMPVTIDMANQSNIWQIGVPSKFIFSSALSLPNAIVTDTLNSYESNNQSSFIVKVNMEDFWAGFPFIVIMWDQKIDCEPNKDGGIIEVSYDSLNTWLNIFQDSIFNPIPIGNLSSDTLFNGEFGISRIDTVWKQIGFCWSNSGFEPLEEFYLRFSFISDSIDTNQEGWMIDNFLAYETIVDATEENYNNSNYFKAANIFPSPANSELNIEFNEPVNSFVQYQIINSNGKIVLQGKDFLLNKMKININSLNDGIYFINLMNSLGETLVTKKWIKNYH